jgi:hypothetical protein
MKRKVLFVFLVAFLTIVAPIHANPQNHNNGELPCDVLKDAFVWSLFKSIGNVLVQYNDERQFVVEKILDIKRLDLGQYYWETTLRVTTFSGAHNPPYHHYTITFSNQNPELEIKAIKIIRE